MGKRESDIYDLVLGISNDTYSHLMTINPLRYYKEYVKVLSDYLSAVELSKSLCTTNILYSVVLRVLKQIRFLLNCNIYYNIWSHVVSTEQNKFTELIVVLEKIEFVFECWIKEQIDSETDVIISKQL